MRHVKFFVWLNVLFPYLIREVVKKAMNCEKSKLTTRGNMEVSKTK